MIQLNANVTLRHLVYFVAVAEAHSFRKAAEALHMSQPPLTQQIQALELALGAKLLERGRRGVEVTPVGQELLLDARRLIGQVNAVAAKVRALGRGESGRVRVGLTDDFIHAPLFAAMTRFAQRNPGILVETFVQVSMTLVRQLQEEELDMVLTNRPISAAVAGLVEVDLAPSRIVAVMPRSHPLAGHQMIGARDLEGEPLIHAPASLATPFARQCDRLFEEAGLIPLVRHHTTNAAIAVELARQGLGIAITSEFSVDAADLASVPLRGKNALLRHVLLVHDRPRAPALERLLQVLAGRGAG